MRRTLVALVLLVLHVAMPLFAATDKAVSIWTAQATNVSTPVDTTGYGEAQVTFWAVSGSPDGTARVYSAAPSGAPLVLLATYATPTTAKTFRGPVGTGIVVTLTGMTTGTVGCVAVLK